MGDHDRACLAHAGQPNQQPPPASPGTAMASAAASREAWKTALWWGPILWTIHDCLASVHWVQRWAVDPRPGEAPPEGGELVVAERLSPRLYQFTRGEVVLMRWAGLV